MISDSYIEHDVDSGEEESRTSLLSMPDLHSLLYRTGFVEDSVLKMFSVMLQVR
jgi:hypothetical protein